MEEVRWGIIGCGDVTEVKSGPALQKVPGSRLVAVMRRNAERAADYARRHGVPRWYDDADALLHDPEVNAVYVATPPSTHKIYTLAAAKAGKPVYVEKPMSVCYADCLEMIRACRDAGVPLFVAYYRRAQPRFLKVKELLAQGEIGQPRLVTVTHFQPPYPRDVAGEYHWRIDPQIAGCGYFCDLAAHTLDLLQFFLGDITEAKGLTAHQMRRYPAEDSVCGVFQFPGAVQGVGIWNFCAYDKLDRNEIVGERGKITFATFQDEPVVLENEQGRREWEIPPPPHRQQPLIRTVVDELLGRGKCPSTGESAARTNWVMAQLLAAPGPRPG